MSKFIRIGKFESRTVKFELESINLKVELNNFNSDRWFFYPSPQLKNLKVELIKLNSNRLPNPKKVANKDLVRVSSHLSKIT